MIGIVVPIYNENDIIEQSILKIIECCKEIDYFICIVEHYDNTSKPKLNIDIPNIFHLRLPRTQPLQERMNGSMVGYKWLKENKKCDVITDIDADVSQDITQLKEGYLLIKNTDFDCVIMSRYVLDGNDSRGLFRDFTSKCITFSCNLFTGWKYNIKDWSHTYRFYSNRAIEKILNVGVIVDPGTMPMIILLNLLQHNFKIKEVPTIFIERGRVSNVKMFRYMFYYYLNLLKGVLVYYSEKNYKKLALRNTK